MVKVALLGIGTVGSGVAELLRDNADKILSEAREQIEIKYILAARPHPESPFAHLMVRDFSVIENDPEIRVVVECIGGKTAALDYVRRALTAGKSVVTSNKELIAECGLELLHLAKQKKVSLLFEASVGGGIPIIRPLSQCLAGNRIEEIYGILNGTTNYILTQMIQCGKDFPLALSEAQQLGYAEADPTADVDGLDACRKICILADMCFGFNVEPAKISVQGIRCVSAEDIALAEDLGCCIKLLGRAVRDGGRICVYVAPHLLSQEKLLSNINGVMNGIVVKGNAVGECMFCGAGAGKMPTASAVVADIIDAVRREDDRKFIDWASAAKGLLEPAETLASRWYVRFDADLPAALAKQAEKTAAHGRARAIITPSMPPAALETMLGGSATGACFRVLD